ncbi:MAG TPA: hypothetical protein VFF64_09945 [Candidatus Eremiobacteraceae bacterium]|nr:hypothetical protein [Candidatus Eremiobacteraceae bacterium]
MSGKGRSPGFAAELDRFPDDDVTIILLSNSYATVSQEPIAKALAAIVFDQEPLPPPAMHAVTISQSILAAYAGMYQHGPEYFVPNAKFNLTADPGYLVLELGDLHTLLVPLSTNDFLERNFFGHVVMSRGEGGNVTGLTTHYGEREFTAGRLEAKGLAFVNRQSRKAIR